MTETYLTGILLAYGAFGLGILSPGPNILAVIGTSMSTDRKSGMALAFGISCYQAVYQQPKSSVTQ